ncbi:MAG: hypothetical protein ACQEXV_22625 [Bacillota bacterium]
MEDLEAKKKALQELESLRGKVSDLNLNFIIEEVKRVFGQGFGAPAVLVNISNYSESEIEIPSKKLEYIITVIISFQGRADIMRFVKYYGENESFIQYHLTPGMVDWLFDAKQKYRDEITEYARE